VFPLLVVERILRHTPSWVKIIDVLVHPPIDPSRSLIKDLVIPSCGILHHPGFSSNTELKEIRSRYKPIPMIQLLLLPDPDQIFLDNTKPQSLSYPPPLLLSLGISGA